MPGYAGSTHSTMIPARCPAISNWIRIWHGMPAIGSNCRLAARICCTIIIPSMVCRTRHDLKFNAASMEGLRGDTEEVPSGLPLRHARADGIPSEYLRRGGTDRVPG